MTTDEINAGGHNGSGDAVRNETQGAVGPVVVKVQVKYKPKDMSEYVQFRINEFNDKARKIYDVLVTEKSIKDFKDEASVITSGFIEKVKDIADVSSLQWVVDDMKSKPTELKREIIAFYKDITGSLKKTYYSLVWLYANCPDAELKIKPGNGGSTGDTTSADSAR